MRVALTGTPGTGKTTVSNLLDTDLDVVHLNDLIESEELYTEVDEERDSKVANLEAVREWLDGRDDILVESHLAHLLDVDRVIVLRCAPTDLEARLTERGEPGRKAEENAEPTESSRALARKARENAESEALDVILGEAVQIHGESNVYEVDTTDREPEAVAGDVEAAITGDRDPSAGDVDFTEYL